jgi:hypothetical protein
LRKTLKTKTTKPPVNLGMIAFGKVKTLEKRLTSLEADFEEIKKHIRKENRKAKATFTYESEKIPYVLARHYIPDFVLATPTGVVYIETKGHLRREDKAKLVAVKKQHPEIDLRILFYAKKKDQIKWAERNGFKHAFIDIPQEWLDGF